MSQYSTTYRTASADEMTYPKAIWHLEGPHVNLTRTVLLVETVLTLNYMHRKVLKKVSTQHVESRASAVWVKHIWWSPSEDLACWDYLTDIIMSKTVKTLWIPGGGVWFHVKYCNTCCCMWWQNWVWWQSYLCDRSSLSWFYQSAKLKIHRTQNNQETILRE